MTEALIYNVTIKVDKAIAEGWLHWMLNEHIPAILQTGCFSSYKVVRLLEVDDSEGPTYAIQYSAASKADYNRFVTVHSSAMQQQSYQKWGNRFIAFRSVMQVIEKR